MKRILVAVLITMVILLAIPVIVLAIGLVDVAATNDPGMLERRVAEFAFERTLATQAPRQSNPFADDPQAISVGLNHYANMCVRCHGGPGLQPEEFAKGLNPPAPMLAYAAEEFSDGELFWIAKHGIRMSGMPAFGVTHKDDDLWKIAAFVKTLPNLSPEQKRQLSQGGGEVIAMAVTTASRRTNPTNTELAKFS